MINDDTVAYRKQLKPNSGIIYVATFTDITGKWNLNTAMKTTKAKISTRENFPRASSQKRSSSRCSRLNHRSGTVHATNIRINFTYGQIKLKIKIMKNKV